MAVATKRRRRAPVRKDVPVTSGTTFHILDQNGVELRPAQAHPGVALVKAQDIALRWGEDGDEATIYVERRTLFGKPIELYRVVRQEDGSITTYTTSLED